MAWNDPLTTHLLDFLFELERNGLKTPLTIAGGFGLFLKRRYLAERGERTLLDMHRARATEDIDIFVRIDLLCDMQQSQSIVDTLHRLGYSPNLNLTERLWKFFKKKILYNKYYVTFDELLSACKTFFRCRPKYRDELRSLLAENFHLYQPN